MRWISIPGPVLTARQHCWNKSPRARAQLPDCCRWRHVCPQGWRGYCCEVSGQEAGHQDDGLVVTELTRKLLATCPSFNVSRQFAHARPRPHHCWAENVHCKIQQPRPRRIPILEAFLAELKPPSPIQETVGSRSVCMRARVKMLEDMIEEGDHDRLLECWVY